METVRCQQHSAGAAGIGRRYRKVGLEVGVVGGTFVHGEGVVSLALIFWNRFYFGIFLQDALLKFAAQLFQIRSERISGNFCREP